MGLEAVWIALIGAVVAICTTLTPLLIARQANRRLDTVALAAAKTAAATIVRLDKTEALAHGIHTLVNNAMTEAKKATLAAKLAHRETLSGRNPSKADATITVALDAEIAELQTEVNERVRQGKVADAQIKAGADQTKQVEL